MDARTRKPPGYLATIHRLELAGIRRMPALRREDPADVAGVPGGIAGGACAVLGAAARVLPPAPSRGAG
jgi:hypothetical protein